MHGTILKDPEKLMALAEQMEAQPTSNPFVSGGVIRAWLQSRDRDTEPFVVVVRDRKERLIAVASWMLTRDRSGLRRLSAIGGEDAWYHDPWVMPGADAEAVAQALVGALRKSQREWDLLTLILRQEASASLLRGVSRLGWSVEDRIDWRQHVLIRWEGDWESYWSERPKKIRGLTARHMRQLKEIPHRFYEASRQEAEPLLEILFQHQASNLANLRDWKPYQDYMRIIARDAIQNNRFSLQVLEIEGATAALQFRSHHGDRVFALLRSFDVAYSRFSPGSLLAAWSLEQMHHDGIRLIDLGPGLNEWKKMVQTHSGESVQLRVGSPASLRGMGWLGWDGYLIPRLKSSHLLRQVSAQVQAFRKKTPAPATR